MSSCRYPKSFANCLHGIQGSLMFIASNIPVRLNSKRVTWAFFWSDPSYYELSKFHRHWQPNFGPPILLHQARLDLTNKRFFGCFV